MGRYSILYAMNSEVEMYIVMYCNMKINNLLKKKDNADKKFKKIKIDLHHTKQETCPLTNFYALHKKMFND